MSISFLKCFLYVFLIEVIHSEKIYEIRIPSESDPGTGPEVDINQGTLEGTTELTRNGRKFFGFKGIPFGTVPKRFNIAVPAQGWEGKRPAKEFGPRCAQFHLLLGKFDGVEDCLTLNVFTPNVSTSKPLPVLFSIFGAGFVFGDSSETLPDYFMDEDVVFVSANYRLSVFGFLNAGIKGASGNQGLKDIVLALKWVRENIKPFGGDPEKVTVFGVSAGGAAVAHLVASPMASGLFHGAIAQSGSVGSGWSQFVDTEFEEPKKLAHAVDCPTSNFEFMVECLRRIKPEILTRISAYSGEYGFDRSTAPVFAPGIETFREVDDDVFQSELAEKVFAEGRQNPVPFMTGIVSLEGLSPFAPGILLNATLAQKMNDQWGRVLPQSLFYWNSASNPCKVSSKLKKLYFEDNPVSLEASRGVINMYSDGYYNYRVWKTGMMHSRVAPTFIYNFTREVKQSCLDGTGWWEATQPGLVLKPPTHGEDMQFLHKNFLGNPTDIPKGSEDFEFSINFVKLWVSFARDGKPSYFWGALIKTEDDIEKVKPDKINEVKWVRIDNELSLEGQQKDFMERMEGWDGICKNDLDYCVPINK